MRHRLATMTRQQRYMVIGGCCLLAAVLMYIFFGIQHGKGTRPQAKNGVPLVAVYKVERADMMRHVLLSGQIVADANIALAPKYTGKIMAVNAQLGDAVKAGDVLLVQDTGDLDISIRQNIAVTKAAAADAVEAEATYNANYLKAQDDYEVQRQKYERNQYLYSIGAISQDTLDAIKQTYMASKAAFEILENQAGESDVPASVESKRLAIDKAAYGTDALRKQREDMILRAPRDGIIGYRAAEVGAIATAGTKVFSLVDTSHVYVDCTISENDAAVLLPGIGVEVTIDALGQKFSGKLIYVSPAMDDSAKTYTARLELDPAQTQIKAGLFARTQVDVMQRPQTLFVPKEAVIKKNGLTSVYIVKDDLTVEKRDVKIGLLNDTTEEIIDGVQNGEVVALTNQDRLKDGMKIQVDDTGASS